MMNVMVNPITYHKYKLQTFFCNTAITSIEQRDDSQVLSGYFVISIDQVFFNETKREPFFIIKIEF